MLGMHNQLSNEFRSFLMPLEFFYSKNEVKLPEIFPINQDMLPELQNKLLAHKVDMTSTLSKFHNSELYINVIDNEINENYVLRMVVLKTIDGDVPVEFGAIGIDLSRLPDNMIYEINDGRKPLGKLLDDHNVEYISNPRGYFKVKQDELISETLNNPVSCDMYGRCNEITDINGFTIADIVEVLPNF
jgi:chorismate-pyruvate lyase